MSVQNDSGISHGTDKDALRDCSVTLTWGQKALYSPNIKVLGVEGSLPYSVTCSCDAS